MRDVLKVLILSSWLYLLVSLLNIFNFLTRYGDDVLDRMWVPFNLIYWKAIKAPYSSSVLSENEFKLPATVMETAVKPVNGSLDFYLVGIDSSQEFYMYFHFAEIEEVQDQIREFTISLNNKTISDPIEPKYMVSDSYFTQSSLSGIQMNFSLAKTNRSTLPPIMNALEIYMIKEFLQSPTEQLDGIRSSPFPFLDLNLLISDTDSWIDL